VQDIISRFQDCDTDGEATSSEVTFRLDIDDSYSPVGTLRMNLIDLLTKDKENVEKEDPTLRAVWMQKRFGRLRELVIKLAPPAFDDKLQEHMFNPPARAKYIQGCDPMELAIDFHGLNDDQKGAARKVRRFVLPVFLSWLSS